MVVSRISGVLPQNKSYRRTIMKTTIHSEKAPAAVGPYVHAVEAGNLVFTSGQLGLIPETGVLP